MSRRRGLLAAAVACGVLGAALIVFVAVQVTRSSPQARQPAGPAGPAAVPPLAPALAPPRGEAFGVNVNLLFNDFSYSGAQIGVQLAAVRATGATLARSDALWEATEPRAPVDGRHTYEWSFDDEIAGSLAAHGLTWLPILDYSAPWAQSIPGQDHSPPRSDAGYADYAAAFAARYGPGGTFWHAHPALTAEPVTAIEIWNEPDNPEFWDPAPDAAAYADLYIAARRAIDGADDGIRVIVGGLTNAPAFLPAMVAAQPQLRGHVDGVAIHPYGTPGTVVARVSAARATLDSLGMASVPLYVTEFGWTTDPPGALDYAPAATRDQYIQGTLTALGHLDCGIAATLLYTWVSPQGDAGDSQDWYGIADPAGGGLTGATAAFAAGLRAGAQPASSATRCAAP